MRLQFTEEMPTLTYLLTHRTVLSTLEVVKHHLWSRVAVVQMCHDDAPHDYHGVW